jgi:hypothetical protein
LRDVMLIFWPTSAFIKVDLPTFGRPTMAIVPQRKPGGEEVTAGSFIVCIPMMTTSPDNDLRS